MKRRSKLLAAILISALTVGSLAGCGGSSGASGTSESGTTDAGEDASLEGENILSGDDSSAANESVTDERESKDTVHIAINAQPATLDIMVNPNFLARQIMGAGSVYEQLVTLDADYKPQLELAESYETSEDMTTWTYHLRKGVKFHDGSEMLAEDVAASVNRWIESVPVAQTACGEARFQVVDEYTVSITLAEPCSQMNMLMAGSSPSCIITTKEAIDSVKDGTLTEYIGTGPYKMAEWATDQYIKLEKFNDYQPYGTEGEFSGWGGYKTAYIDTAYYDIVSDDSTRIAGIQSGQYDMLFVPCPLDNFDQLTTSADTTLIKEDRGNFLIVYNKKGEATGDKVVRQAINKLLNYDEVMTAAFVDSKFYTLTPSIMFNEKSMYYTEAGKEDFYQNDPEGAIKLLEDNGFDLSTPIKVLTPTNYTEYYNAELAISNQLEEAGLNPELVSMDWASCYSTMESEDGWDIFVYTVADSILPPLLQYLSGPAAHGFPEDETVQTLQHDILFAPDDETAVAKWKELQEYMWTDYVPVTSFGAWQSYSAIAGDYDMSFMQGGILWNAKFYE